MFCGFLLFKAVPSIILNLNFILGKGTNDNKGRLQERFCTFPPLFLGGEVVLFGAMDSGGLLVLLNF